MVLSMARPWKHPKTGVYYYRRVVPESLRVAVGKVEERVSLRTKDPREASGRHPEVAARVAAHWQALREGPKPLSRGQAAALAGLWYQWFIPIFEEDPGEDPDAWALWSEQLHDLDLSGRPELDERDIPDLALRSPAVQRKVEAFLMDRGRISSFLKAKDIHLHETQLPEFLDSLEPEFHAAMRLLGRRARRDFGRDRRPERFPEWQGLSSNATSSTANGDTGVTLTGILDGWWREAQAAGRKPSTFESYSNTTAALVGFLGHDDVRRVCPPRTLCDSRIIGSRPSTRGPGNPSPPRP